MFVRMNWRGLFGEWGGPALVLFISAAALIVVIVVADSRIEEAKDNWIRAEWRADSIGTELRMAQYQLNRRVFVVSNFRKASEWFVFMQIGESARDHVYASNLDIDVENLRYIYKVCADSSVPLWFVNETLWRESRFGTNVRHARNRNHHPASLGNPKKDVFKFIVFFRNHIQKYDTDVWNGVYRLGETRARKYRLIP